MRMLCQINRNARWDMIKNDIIKKRVEVTPILKKIVENSLTGFSIQKEKTLNVVVRKVDHRSNQKMQRNT